MSKITDIRARYILDSRGNPTIEADVILSNNIVGRASVPSGASTGQFEALELRDKDNNFNGKHVLRAINNIDTKIKPLLLNMNINDIRAIDYKMIQADGTDNKNQFGANAILAVSLASLRAAANNKKNNLYEYINTIYPSKMSLPIPMMNILNGGSHADNTLDIQEFMIYPTGFNTFDEAIQAGVEIFHKLKMILNRKGYNTAIGDEGGFAPSLTHNEEALELILEAVHHSGYKLNNQILLALDVAASEFYNKKTGLYELQSENKTLSSVELIDYYDNLCNKYPIISIEDPIFENDWDGWQLMLKKMGDKIQIVGDDLTVTNSDRLKRAISDNAINAILIKLNQIGSFTETMETIDIAKKNNLGYIISHRSGETEDTIIADLAVACNAGQIKTGSLCRTDRTAKYNQLLRINESSNIPFANLNYIKCEKK